MHGACHLWKQKTAANWLKSAHTVGANERRMRAANWNGEREKRRRVRVLTGCYFFGLPLVIGNSRKAARNASIPI